jgi:hypothetical protein
MAYVGDPIEIPLGQLGMRTDDPHTDLEPGHVIRALNASFTSGRVQKDPGSRQWNDTAYPAGVIAARDWFPDVSAQRLVFVCSNGRIYRAINPQSYTEIAATGGAPDSLQTGGFMTIVACGEEELGNPKKLFIMSGADPVQVVTGDTVTRRDISSGAADWTGPQNPFFALVHRSRLFALTTNHQVYVSSATDHEDFTTSPLQFSVFPGEGERISTAHVYKGRLFVGKYPKGLYMLIDDDASEANWYFQRVSGSIGFPTPQSIVEAVDDLITANSYGSLTSIKAVEAFGDVASADIFAQLRVQDFVQNEIALDEVMGRQGIYYQTKKLLLFSYQSAAGIRNDRICALDVSNTQNPKVSWITKDQPNCLFLRKDSRGLERPYYGAADGYVYEMDQEDRIVGRSEVSETAYTLDIQTPWFDFGRGAPAIAEANKLFDELEVVYEPCGNWDLNVDVYIDNYFHRTLQFKMKDGAELEEFRLDQDLLSDGPAMSEKQSLDGSGRRISFRCYNSGAGENVRIIKLRVYVRIAGQEQETKG